MLVYVAMAAYGENVKMVGVFSSYEKANNYLKKYYNPNVYDNWVVEETIK